MYFCFFLSLLKFKTYLQHSTELLIFRFFLYLLNKIKNKIWHWNTICYTRHQKRTHRLKMDYLVHDMHVFLIWKFKGFRCFHILLLYYNISRETSNCNYVIMNNSSKVGYCLKSAKTWYKVYVWPFYFKV